MLASSYFHFSLKFIANHINIIINLIIEVRIAALNVIWEENKFDNCSRIPGIIKSIVIVTTNLIGTCLLVLPEWYLLME